jgi:hypothetical protein
VNLLASGTTGTLLNAAEIKTARQAAPKVDGSASVAKIAQQAERAESDGDHALARRRWTWLAEIPGDGSVTACRQAERRDAQPAAENGRHAK